MVNLLNKRVQFPRGTTRMNDGYIGPDGQVTVDNEKKELRLHDGKRKGGWAIVPLEMLKKLFLTRDTETGALEFANDQTGLVSRIGTRDYALRTLEGGNGVDITNPDGKSGNPKIDLPDRLKASLPNLTDANDAKLTGFYLIPNSTNSNLPPDFIASTDVFLTVFNNEDTLGGTILQLAHAAQTNEQVSYMRRKIGTVWSSWVSTNPAGAVPAIDERITLENGIDETPRPWSAYELRRMISLMAMSLQALRPDNVGEQFYFNPYHTIPGSGLVTSKQVASGFTLATGDRLEVVASATAVSSNDGDSQTAMIEVQKADGTWNVVAQQTVTILPGEPTKTIEILGRIIKTADGYYIVDRNWTIISTVVASLTSAIRVTVGIDGTSGARIHRWRPY